MTGLLFRGRTVEVPGLTIYNSNDFAWCLLDPGDYAARQGRPHLVLAAVAIGTGGGLVELVGAAAVTLSFAHAQVADRLAERDAARARPSVDCHRWATRYLVGKETLWLAYFAAHRSWSALAGVALFLVYTPWRRWWRARHPLGRSTP